ncbi:helix-turn-helix domain-containing protein [Nakamurella aerolata]|uniref:AraC family transcriptional regulator n=1 Tax=Nakamurella aerolata TaxID=1656892 RepID=A0A849AF10_9ACTN|nr:AraC family transcriptional regulator [Nakamurella aerolata]NNG35432.1 AraC family transcriptional regulator [Nakamurella aerolata]
MPASAPTFVSLGHYSAPKGRDAPPHRHAVWKVAVYLRGNIRTTVDGVEHQIRPGAVLVVPPQGAHAEYATTGYANRFLLVNAPDRWPWPTYIAPDSATALARVLADLADETATLPWGEPPGELADVLLRELDIRLRRFADPLPSKASAIVTAAERIMADRHQQRVTVAAVAAELGVSVSTLRAHFERVLGSSPQSRLRAIRLEHAITLLRTSDLTVESVAARSGYYSAAHLARQLREDRGRPPTAFRAGR